MNEFIIKSIDITLKTALKLLSKSGQKCLVIVNKNKKLIRYRLVMVIFEKQLFLIRD